MRRAAIVLLLIAGLSPTFARTTAPHAPAPAPRAASGPPHAWLFGTWTGGLFPVLDGMAAQDCKTEPTVAFSRDLVSHATLLGTRPAQSSVETVRATANGAEFRFVAGVDPAADFGCDAPDTLHVLRSSLNEISFPRVQGVSVSVAAVLRVLRRGWAQAVASRAVRRASVLAGSGPQMRPPRRLPGR